MRRGVSLGASATILCGIEAGEWAMIAAESVVIRSAPLHALVAGVPARVIGDVCACERRVEEGCLPRTECGRCLAQGRAVIDISPVSSPQ